MSEWKTSQEWADHLGMSREGVRHRAKKGAFQRKRDGRNFLYRPVEGNALAPRNKRAPMPVAQLIERLAAEACLAFHGVEIEYMSDEAKRGWHRVAVKTLAAAEGLL